MGRRQQRREGERERERERIFSMAARVSRIYWSGLILLTLCFLSSASDGGGAATTATVRRRQLETRRLLKKLNKPAVKSIKSPDGDIIDCVHISQQPAFDHPLLRNHTIQMRPSFHPKSQFDEINLSSKFSNSNHQKQSRKEISQTWHKNGRCPKNTIPIRRIMEEDVLRATSVKSYGRKKRRTIPFPLSSNPDIKKFAGREYAIINVKGDKYYGAMATMNVWNPYIQQINGKYTNEMSLSQLWIKSGKNGVDLNVIEAGWQVYPFLYGDNKTRLFGYWTRDAYKTGCYNTVCPGFVQLSEEVALGAPIGPISHYNGDQYEITILIWKDPVSKNWWMKYQDQYIGYWPSDLFTHLAHSASSIDWGGEVYNREKNGSHTTTQMGSGHFAEEGPRKASYLRNIQIVDSSNNLIFPQNITTDTEHSSCYNLHNDQNENSPSKYFYFGGPGKNPNCP